MAQVEDSKMKKQYEIPELKVALIDKRIDIITESDNNTTPPMP